MKLNQSQQRKEEENRLVPEGDYVFEILSAKEEPNSKSSDGLMTKLKLRLYVNGRKHTQNDVLGQWNYGASKVKSFLDALGLDVTEDHDPNDYIGMTGTVHIRKGLNKSTQKIQNEVGWYIPLAPGATPPALPTQEDEDEFSPVSDDDRPF